MAMNVQFDIPDGYFENLSDRIMNRIDYEENKRKHKRNLIIRRLCFSAAAVLCAGIFCFSFFKTDFSDKNSEKNTDYYTQYASDLLGNSADVTALYYTSGEDNSFLSEDLSEVLNNYPSPITISEYYD
ncbi:MAG: hypothetical protein II956_08945 [Bacteroidales bacterium]|nr:hypothetical protein [Bacteroidales bacterium]